MGVTQTLRVSQNPAKHNTGSTQRAHPRSPVIDTSTTLQILSSGKALQQSQRSSPAGLLPCDGRCQIRRWPKAAPATPHAPH